jgi:hypothetical protein
MLYLNYYKTIQLKPQDSQPDGSQRLCCTLCPGKSFKDNNRLKIEQRNLISR